MSDEQFSMTEKSSNVCGPKKEFKLVISNKTWKDLKTKVIYGNRKYTVMKQNKWSNIFAKKIFE